jgi:hypothetical protein
MDMRKYADVIKSRQYLSCHDTFQAVYLLLKAFP